MDEDDEHGDDRSHDEASPGLVVAKDALAAILLSAVDWFCEEVECLSEEVRAHVCEICREEVVDRLEDDEHALAFSCGGL